MVKPKSTKPTVSIPKKGLAKPTKPIASTSKKELAKATNPIVSATKKEVATPMQPTNLVESAFNHGLHINALDKHPQKHEHLQTMLSMRLNASLVAKAKTDNQLEIPLTTVSMSGNFDAYIHITFNGKKNQDYTTLLVDSGNTCLIVPRFEDIDGLPEYTVLGEGTEPWGSPAKVVKGPIQIPTSSGELYTINDCVFYACTGGKRTANFGTGCISPWAPQALPNVILQAPLSYNTEYPIAEFNYEAAENMINSNGELTVATGSVLTLYKELPEGYSMFNIIKNFSWMSLVPTYLWIDGIPTGWPNNPHAVAFVDTGGGPMFLSDPQGLIYPYPLPETVACPTWSGGSSCCNCTGSKITLQLMDPDNPTFWNYTVDTTKMPSSVQGLTLVACQNNTYMMGQVGMNIGGISALVMYILIDYSSQRVGFKHK